MSAESDAGNIDTDILLQDNRHVVRSLKNNRSKCDESFLLHDSDSDSNICNGTNNHSSLHKSNTRQTSLKTSTKYSSNAIDQKKPPRSTHKESFYDRKAPPTPGVRRCKSVPHHGHYGVDQHLSGDLNSESEASVISTSTDYSPLHSPELGRKKNNKNKGPLVTRPNRAYLMRCAKSNDADLKKSEKKTRHTFTYNTQLQYDRPKSAGYNKLEYRAASEGRDLKSSTCAKRSSSVHRQSRSVSMGRELSNNTLSTSNRNSSSTDRCDASLGNTTQKKGQEALRSASSAYYKNDVNRQRGVSRLKSGSQSRPSERKSLQVSGQKSQPSSRSSSPKSSPGYSAWMRRKEYDPAKAAAKDRAQKSRDKMVRARSVGPLDDKRYSGRSSISSEDQDSYLEDGHELSVSELCSERIGRMSSNIASDISNMSHDLSHMSMSMESNESFQVADLPYDKQVCYVNYHNSNEYQNFIHTTKIYHICERPHEMYIKSATKKISYVYILIGHFVIVILH